MGVMAWDPPAAQAGSGLAPVGGGAGAGLDDGWTGPLATQRGAEAGRGEARNGGIPGRSPGRCMSGTQGGPFPSATPTC